MQQSTRNYSEIHKTLAHIASLTKEDFIRIHTRKEIAEMLRILFPYHQQQLGEKGLAFRSCPKKRQYRHIEHYARLHGMWREEK